MKFSNEVILIAIVIILFIIGGMIAAGFGYFFGHRSKNPKEVFKKSSSEDDFAKEDFSQIKIYRGEHSVSKRNWLAISRNLVLFLIIALITGGGIYYYFLKKGMEASSIESLSQIDNSANNPVAENNIDKISASSDQDQKEENASTWENYTNTAYNYTLHHPVDYSITSIDDNVTAVKISPPESTSLWLQVEVQSNPDQLPSGAYASKFPPEGEIKQRANLVIAEIPSVRLETEKELITYVANGPKVIIFKLPSADISDDQNQDLTNFKRIITTLKFK